MLPFNFFGLGQPKRLKPPELAKTIATDLASIKAVAASLEGVYDLFAVPSSNEAAAASSGSGGLGVSLGATPVTASQLKIHSDFLKKAADLSVKLQQVESIASGDKADEKQALTQCLLERDGELITVLIKDMRLLEFESRKRLVTIIHAMLSASEAVQREFVQASRPLTALFNGYNDPRVAFFCGMILREIGKMRPVAEAAWRSGLITGLLPSTKVQNFDVAGDAWATLRLFLVHGEREVAQAFLMDPRNYEAFFSVYNTLLETENNYVTQRSGWRLLNELMLDKGFFKTTMMYVDDPNNLVRCMKQLKQQSRATAFEVFHVFKVFLANPNKSVNVHRLLYQNKAKILKFLEDFLADRRDDEGLTRDREVCEQKLLQLGPPETNPNHPDYRTPKTTSASTH